MLKKIKTVLLIAALSLSFWAFCACTPETEIFTVTVSGILRSSLSVYNNDIGVFWFNVVVLLS